MGPLFSLILITLGSVILFIVVFLVFWIFVPMTDALLRACGFVVGAGAGAAFSVLFLAMLIALGTTLTPMLEALAFLATVAAGAIASGVLSYIVARTLRWNRDRFRLELIGPARP
jgi:hypothetical protein